MEYPYISWELLTCAFVLNCPVFWLLQIPSLWHTFINHELQTCHNKEVTKFSLEASYFILIWVNIWLVPSRAVDMILTNAQQTNVPTFWDTMYLYNPLCHLGYNGYVSSCQWLLVWPLSMAARNLWQMIQVHLCLAFYVGVNNAMGNLEKRQVNDEWVETF